MSFKKPVYYEYDIDKMENLDLISVGHVDNINNSAVELRLMQNGKQVDVTGATVTARVVTRKTHILINDNVSCTVNESGNIIVPFDRPSVVCGGGDLRVEVNITDSDSELTLQFPLWVRVNPSILDDAELAPESLGTIPELMEEVAQRLEALDQFASLDDVSEIIDDILSAGGSEAPRLTVELYQGSYWLTYYDSENGNAHRTVNLSQFFLSSHQDITGKVDKTATIAGVDLQDNISAVELRTALSVPAKTSDLTNDSGFLPIVDADSVSSCTENGVIYRLQSSGVYSYVFNIIIEQSSWIQYKIDVDGTVSARTRLYSHGAWDAFGDFVCYEDTFYKTTAITNLNNTSTENYPSVKAVVDYIAAQGFLTSHQDISGKANTSDVYLRSQLSTKTLSVTDGNTTTNYSVLVVNNP